MTSPPLEHFEYEVRPSPPSPTPKHHILTTPKQHLASTTPASNTTTLDRKSVRTSGCASKPQHKHLRRLTVVDAYSKAPTTLSLSKVVGFGGAQLGSTYPLQRHLRTPKRKSRLARAVLEAIQGEA